MMVGTKAYADFIMESRAEEWEEFQARQRCATCAWFTRPAGCPVEGGVCTVSRDWGDLMWCGPDDTCGGMGCESWAALR